jgi:arginine decarboxylase
MLHVFDEQFNRALFLEAYRMHTSTSPNYQIIASLDVGRRQASLEGYERVKRAISLSYRLRQKIQQSPLLSSLFRVLDDTALIPEPYRQSTTSGALCYGDIPRQWEGAQFVVDPTRITVDISGTGMDGSRFRELLINQYHIQVNKTSRKTVLFIVNIGASEASIDYLIQVLSDITLRLTQNNRLEVPIEAEQVIELPQRRRFHPVFEPDTGQHFSTVDIRSAYYAAFDEDNIEYITLDNDLLKRVMNDQKLISAAFVTPYPPGFPIIVPGQIITHDILLYLQKMRIKEIHGYRADVGLKVFTHTYLTSIYPT